MRVPNKLIIYPSCLKGKVRVSGAKNSALRMLAASLLTNSKICLKNYPSNLLDAQVHVKMLNKLGKRCNLIDDQTIEIFEKGTILSNLKWTKRSIRNTLLILGALLARTGKAKVPLPGGCCIGKRKHDLHIMVLKSFGARVWEEANYLCAEIPINTTLKGTDIHLPIRSTGATENSIIIGCLAKGTTRIFGPHIRPEICDLIHFLNSMGAKIKINGQESIIIEGVKQLKGTVHKIIPDSIEAMTWLIGAAITKGNVEIVDFPFKHLEVPLIYLRESGVNFKIVRNSLIVNGSKCYPIDLSTGPYPGVNSDMQPLFAVSGAIAKGESKIVDLRFPGRYEYSDELSKLGVKCIVNNNLLVIKGGYKLTGTKVNAIDLRAGAALMVAGFIAGSKTIIQNPWQIYRGYDNLEKKLKILNCNFKVYGTSKTI